jgi:methyltransferase
MVRSQALYLGFLALVVAERLVELAISRRNVAKALARGGLEVGQRHFRIMSALHSLFLASCAAEALVRDFPGALGWLALAGALAAQGLRWWAVASLGERWNVRVVVLPGAAPVTRGPYRWVRHPNYAAVVLEMACIPLIHGAWLTALAFSLANAALLRVRIAVEEEALGASWAREFASRPRFVPGAGAGSGARP